MMMSSSLHCQLLLISSITHSIVTRLLLHKIRASLDWVAAANRRRRLVSVCQKGSTGMGTALASTAQSLRSSHFFRFSFNLFRNLSSASSSASTASQNPTTPKKSKRRKKNLFEVAQFLPNWGIGYQVAKTHWTDVSYEITKINLYKDGRHGKAWGIVHKNGQS